MILFPDACFSEEEVAACEPAPRPDADLSVAGAAPWDPYLLSVDDDWGGLPVVAGADGLLTLTPLVVPDVLPESSGLFRPTPEREPGEYVTVGAWGVPSGDTVSLADDDRCPAIVAPVWTENGETTAVEAFGRDPAFDPTQLAGTRHLVTPSVAFVGGSGTLGSLVGSLSPLHLEILEADEATATFRLLSQVYNSTDECVLLQDVAQLSATGELTWARDRIETETQPAPLVLHSPSIRLGFLGDRGAGGEVATLADVRGTEGTESDLCDLSASFGGVCQPCPEDDHPSCLGVAGFGWTSQRVDEPIDLDLPWCGVDFSNPDNVPEWNFDFTCETDGLCALTALGLTAPLVWRRRRISRRR